MTTPHPLAGQVARAVAVAVAGPKPAAERTPERLGQPQPPGARRAGRWVPDVRGFDAGFGTGHLGQGLACCCEHAPQGLQVITCGGFVQ